MKNNRWLILGLHNRTEAQVAIEVTSYFHDWLGTAIGLLEHAETSMTGAILRELKFDGLIGFKLVTPYAYMHEAGQYVGAHTVWVESIENIEARALEGHAYMTVSLHQGFIEGQSLTVTTRHAHLSPHILAHTCSFDATKLKQTLSEILEYSEGDADE